jgi:4-amino-4-deoxychorismate lyase
MTTRTLVDGQPGASVSAEDRGLMYGDGVFRTLFLRAGEPVWWDAHLARLARDCAVLGLAPVSESDWRADLERLDPPEADAVLKLMVTRGAGTRGYRPTPGQPGTRIAMLAPAPAPRADAGSIRARVCHLRLGHQPVLAGVKHLNRLENVLAQAEWDDPGIAEGLMLDQDGHVVCGTKSNILLVRSGRLFTPALSRCGIAGVARERILDIARAAGIEVEMTDGLWLGDVLNADEVLFCNSVIGLWRVGRIEDRTWDGPALLYPMLKERLHGQKS